MKKNILPPGFKNWLQLLFSIDWKFFLDDSHNYCSYLSQRAEKASDKIDAYEFDKNLLLANAMKDLLKILPSDPAQLSELRMWARQGFFMRYDDEKMPKGIEFLENLEDLIYRGIGFPSS